MTEKSETLRNKKNDKLKKMEKVLKGYIKVEKTILKFDDTEIEKQKFHQHKKTFLVKSIDINEIVVSNKVSFGRKGFKYFIGCKDAERIRPLCIYLPKMSAYRRDFEEIKYMSFLIKDDELLGKYNEIWEILKIASKRNLIVNQYTMKNI